MKRLLTVLAYAISFSIAYPTYAALQVVARDCGPYHFEIQPVLNGTVFRVKEGGRTRESFYGSRGITIIPGCQGNKIAFSERFASKYSDSTLVSLVNPEGSTVRIEKAMKDLTVFTSGALLPSTKIKVVNGVYQNTVGYVRFNEPPTILTVYEPADIEMQYLSNGSVVKRHVPHVRNPQTLPWPNTTSSMVYFAEYYFDGQNVLVHEQMFSTYSNEYKDWLNGWSKLEQNGTYTSITPPDLAANTQPDEELWEPLAQILHKTRLINKSETLTDRSYFVFGARGGVIRRIAPSSWNSILGESSIQCGNVQYTLYKKQLSGPVNATSTFPSFQYLIEREEGSVRSLIPIPHVDGSWKLHLSENGQYWVPNEGSITSASLESCAGKSAILLVMTSRYFTDSSGLKYTNAYHPRALAITPGMAYANYLDAKISVSNDAYNTFHKSPLGYHLTGIIQRKENEISGSATITEIIDNGRVVRTKPPYFRDLLAYHVGAYVVFYRHPTTGQFIAQFSYPDRDVGNYDPSTNWTHEVYVYENGIYQLVPKVSYVYELDPASYQPMKTGVSLYVNKEKDFLTLKSFFLNRTTLLHDLSGKKFTLDWYRTGMLAPDGTQKIWYAFTTGGRQQTWQATIR